MELQAGPLLANLMRELGKFQTRMRYPATQTWEMRRMPLSPTYTILTWVPCKAPTVRQAWEGRHESTWLTQLMDQDIYSEWDPVAQSERSQVQVQAGAWASERGAVAWQRERDEMRQEIHFLQRNMEFLLACTEVVEWDRQDPPQLPPPPPLEGGSFSTTGVSLNGGKYGLQPAVLSPHHCRRGSIPAGQMLAAFFAKTLPVAMEISCVFLSVAGW
uniref:Uncharacterized protein n=1 Tax=Sphaerodactylus townsendi TaxID=933632 RepID=A0ACB8FXE0_9SAUR